MEAKYIQKGDSLDYTPNADTDAGTIVYVGNIAGVTKLDIKANTLGALAISGVYEIAKKENEAVTAGAVLYWDTDDGATATAGALKKLGTALKAAAATDTTVVVIINAG